VNWELQVEYPQAPKEIEEKDSDYKKNVSDDEMDKLQGEKVVL
jgi:hypothetical protein